MNTAVQCPATGTKLVGRAAAVGQRPSPWIPCSIDFENTYIEGQDPNICSDLIAHFAPDTIDTHGFPRHRVSELDRDMHAWPLAAAFEVPT